MLFMDMCKVLVHLRVLMLFRPCMVKQMLYIGKASKGKIPLTWHFLNIKIPRTALYELPKNQWVIAHFEISGPVRNKSLVTVSLDHSVSSDSDTKYFLSHYSNVMSFHQWKTFQVIVTDDVYPPTRLCWCNYTRGCQAVVTWCNV